ncbi:DNA excision repair protein ERCC-8-like [Cloeon dipterum]|uniref:DNA excision repair protein ERCC-8-like n=1 Tax=Cloeon dipterum TaxID=197152 RepID=UPI0032205210
MIRDLHDLGLGLISPGRLRRVASDRLAVKLRLSRHTRFLRNHRGAILSLDVDGLSGRFVLAASSPSKITIHDLQKPDSEILPPQFHGNRNAPTAFELFHESVCCVQWYPGSVKIITSSGKDGSLRMWDVCNRVVCCEVKPVKENRLTQHHQSPASKIPLVAVASPSPGIPVLDLRYGKSPMTLKNTLGPVTYVQWSPTDEHAIASAAESVVLLWDVRIPSKPLLRMDMSNSRMPATTSTSHMGLVNCLEFSLDGRTLISYGTDNSIRMWDTQSGVLSDVNCGSVDNCVRVSVRMALNRGRRMFVPSRHHIRVFDLDTGERVHNLKGHMSDVYCVRYNPHFEILHSGGRDRNVINWTMQNYKNVCTKAAEDSDDEN